MRTIIFFTLLTVLLLPKPAQSQGVTDSFSVALTPNNNTFIANYPESFVSWSVNSRGINYNIKGYLYPGNYFEENCPLTKNCGIIIDTVGFDMNGAPIVNAIAEDTTIVIGEWDCRSFVVGFHSIGVIGEEETIGEIACQTFDFYPHPLSPCPDGCYVVTEGFLDQINTANSGDLGLRSLTGGTNEFKSIRGDLYSVHLPSSDAAAADSIVSFGRNITGSPNATFSFKYGFLTQTENFEWSLDVSIKQQTLIIDGPKDSISGMPARGAVFMLEGVIYEGGTLMQQGPNSGLDMNGLAEWDSIGKWMIKGIWNSEEYDINNGLFAVNKQYFELNHPSLGPVQIITDSDDGAILGVPQQQLVLGGTNKLFGHTGESTQTIIGQNTTDGLNLAYIFESNGLLTGTETIPADPIVSMQLYPNPATNQMSIKLDQLKEFGFYTFEMVNVSGQRMLYRSFDINAATFFWNLDVSGFADGWYGLVVKKGGRVISSKGFAKVR